MSTTELRRAGVLARVAAETLTLKSAAVLMEVSYRQAKRLYRRYRAEGAKGLKHRSAGRRSNRAAPPRLQKRVLTLIRQKYGGGGHTLASGVNLKGTLETCIQNIVNGIVIQL